MPMQLCRLGQDKTKPSEVITELSDRIYRDASDPNSLTLIFSWQMLKNMPNRPPLKAAMEKAGVEGPPSIYFLNEV